jgi:hypothetical protein
MQRIAGIVILTIWFCRIALNCTRSFFEVAITIVIVMESGADLSDRNVYPESGFGGLVVRGINVVSSDLEGGLERSRLTRSVLDPFFDQRPFSHRCVLLIDRRAITGISEFR